MQVHSLLSPLMLSSGWALASGTRLWHPPPLEGRPPLMPVAAIYYCYQPNWRPHLFPLHSIMASKHIKHNLYKQKNCWKMSLFHITPEHQDILEKKDSSSCSKVVFDHQYNSEVRWTGEKLKGVPGGISWLRGSNGLKEVLHKTKGDR